MSIQIGRAMPSDIPAIAALFTQAFEESVLHHCGRLPRPLAMEDVFTLVYQAEPAAAFLARNTDGVVVGYCFAPTRLSALWQHAIIHGHVFKWAWRWLTGQYGFGLYPVKVMALNKLAFLRSALTPTQAANARILSIAVAENYRGQGIAQALMQSANDYFTASGVTRVRLEVRPDNLPAVKVYEKSGYRSAGYTYDSQGPWLIMFKEMGEC